MGTGVLFRSKSVPRSRQRKDPPPLALAAAVVALLAGACPAHDGNGAAAPPQGVGVGSTAGAKQSIIHGSSAPTVVSLSAGQLQAIGALRVQGGTFCTATLIAPQVVVTAAHCVPASLDEVDFAFGRDAHTPTAAIPVVDAVGHPQYRAHASVISARYDVALFLLAVPASQVAPGVVPIAFNGRALDDLAGLEVQNVGYGVTRGGGRTAGRRLWSAERVAAVSSYDFTTRFEENGSGTCRGDSGGPSLRMVNGRLTVVGTVSWGTQGCGGDAHFALASFNATWVQQTLALLGAEIDDVEASAGDDPCGGITYAGQCEGDVSVWCEGGELAERDCAADGQLCGDTGGDQGFYCMDPPDKEADDPCQGLTYAGACVGGEVWWCEDEQLLYRDCHGEGFDCLWVSSESYFDCG